MEGKGGGGIEGGQINNIFAMSQVDRDARNFGPPRNYWPRTVFSSLSTVSPPFFHYPPLQVRLFTYSDLPALVRFVWNLPKASSVIRSYQQCLSTGCWRRTRTPIYAFVAEISGVVAGFALLELETEVDFLRVSFH